MLCSPHWTFLSAKYPFWGSWLSTFLATCVRQTAWYQSTGIIPGKSIHQPGVGLKKKNTPSINGSTKTQKWFDNSWHQLSTVHPLLHFHKWTVDKKWIISDSTIMTSSLKKVHSVTHPFLVNKTAWNPPFRPLTTSTPHGDVKGDQIFPGTGN